jgi:hypothetical protein
MASSVQTIMQPPPNSPSVKTYSYELVIEFLLGHVGFSKVTLDYSLALLSMLEYVYKQQITTLLVLEIEASCLALDMATDKIRQWRYLAIKLGFVMALPGVVSLCDDIRIGRYCHEDEFG